MNLIKMFSINEEATLPRQSTEIHMCTCNTSQARHESSSM